jgi:hypothetical protein
MTLRLEKSPSESGQAQKQLYSLGNAMFGDSSIRILQGAMLAQLLEKRSGIARSGLRFERVLLAQQSFELSHGARSFQLFPEPRASRIEHKRFARLAMIQNSALAHARVLHVGAARNTLLGALKFRRHEKIWRGA